MTTLTPDGTFYRLYKTDDDTEGKALILIHGLGLNHDMWREQTEALVKTFKGTKTPSYQVLSYDLYGHGRSSPPPEIPSLTLFSRQLKTLMQHLNLSQAIIMGFSLGGMIVRRFAMDYPDMAQAIAILHSPH